MVKLLNQQFLPHDGVCLRHLSGKMMKGKAVIFVVRIVVNLSDNFILFAMHPVYLFIYHIHC